MLVPHSYFSAQEYGRLETGAPDTEEARKER